MTDPEQSPKQYRKVINSWVMYDWANSAFATTVMAAILPVYYSKVAGAILLSRVDVKRGIHRAREEDMNAKILLSEN